jgi:hypothetical protein
VFNEITANATEVTDTKGGGEQEPIPEETTPVVKEPVVPAVKEEPVVKEPVVPAVKEEPDYKALYDAEVQRSKSWEGRISAAEKRNKDLEAKIGSLPAVPSKVVPEVKVELTADESKLLSDFQTEMGEEFIKPVTVLIRKMVKETLGPELQELKALLEGTKGTAESAVKKTETLSTVTHFQAVEAAHPDLDTILESGDLTVYAKSLPYEEAQKALQIIDRGNTRAVIKLLNEYKEARGITKAKPIETKITDVISKDKINNATAVKGAGPILIPKTESDKNDFTGAFNEAVAKSELRQ